MDALLITCPECDGHRVRPTQVLREVEQYVAEIVSGYNPKTIRPPLSTDMYTKCTRCQGKGRILTPEGREVAGLLTHFGLIEDTFLWGG
jgi:DnaJ-class molecular chaperone